MSSRFSVPSKPVFLRTENGELGTASSYQGVGTLTFRDTTATSVHEKLKFPRPERRKSSGGVGGDHKSVGRKWCCFSTN
jgi:hypothetical protein